jgi:hypothetical protein
MTDAADLLRLAVFQDQDFIRFERGVVMTTGISGDYRQTDLFSENADPLLLFVGFGRRRGLRISLRSNRYGKQNYD